MAEHVVKTKDENGEEYNLDLLTGRRYDAAGNELPFTWRPVEGSETCAMMADHIADRDEAVRHMAARAAIQTDPSQPRQTLMRRMKYGAGAGTLVKMELGVGDVHIPTAIPNFATGYSNELPVADVYAHTLLVDKPSNKFYQFDKKDAFQPALPQGATGGAQVQEIAPRLATGTYTTLERALAGFVSTELVGAADAALKLRQATMNRIHNALLINREIRVATLATTTGTWDASVRTTLGAGFQWNGGASSDPIADLLNAIATSWGKPDGIIMSRPVYNAFIQNPKVRGYYAYKSNVAPMPSASELQAILQLPRIYVADMQYIDSNGNKSYIWGNNVVLFKQPAEMPPSSQVDVASAYTFRWNVQGVRDGGASGGWIVREYFVQDRGPLGGNKMVVVHNDAEVQTSTFAGFIIASAYQ